VSSGALLMVICLIVSSGKTDMVTSTELPVWVNDLTFQENPTQQQSIPSETW